MKHNDNRTRAQLIDQMMQLGLSYDEAERAVDDLLSGRLVAGNVQGGLHPEHFADIINRAFFTQGLKRVVLDIHLEVDEYHLGMTVLATGEVDAEQLAQVAQKVQGRKREGEPN